MREAYLRAGPDFQLSKMTPRPLDLGPITTLTNLGRIPYLKMVAGLDVVRAVAGRGFLFHALRTMPGAIPSPLPRSDQSPPLARDVPCPASTAAGACLFFIPPPCC